MRFKFESSVFVSRMSLALMLVLLGGLSVEAQCNLQQTHKLLPNDGAATFGQRSQRNVAISGDTAIVGATYDDDNGETSGSAYLFDTTTGQQIAKLLPDDGVAGDEFGRSVAISGTTAIVGAFRDDDVRGAAYLFDTTTGNQIAKLVANDRNTEDFFGWAVGISGTIAIVGAIGDDDRGQKAGAAYLFDTTTGQQIDKLYGGGAYGEFGVSVFISGTTAIVGTTNFIVGTIESAYVFEIPSGQQIAKLQPNEPSEDDRFGWYAGVAISGTVGIVGAGWDDDNGENSGSAYLFDITTGQQIAKLLPDDGAAGDHFGAYVAISGTIAVVGAPSDDDNGDNSGSAYLFDTTTHQQIAKLYPSDGAAGDGFGKVAMSGTTVLVGAKGDDDNGEDSGSAYLFDVSGCVDTDVVTANSFLVTRGTYVSGGLVELAARDNLDLSIQRSTADIQSRTEFEVMAVSPVASPSSLTVTLEGSVFARSQVNQTIELFDYFAFPAGTWVQVDTRAATRFTDSTVTVAANGDLSRFVELGTMSMKARIRYQSPVARQRFASNTDQFVWAIGQ